jgi:hypothetical protein
MPAIEIISLRFNLDKEDDRKLWEELIRRIDPGKRNEFLKKLLLENILKNGDAGSQGARKPKKQLKETAHHPSPQPVEAAGPEPPAAPGPPVGQKVVPAESREKPLADHEDQAGTEAEAASLVSQFAQ